MQFYHIARGCRALAADFYLGGTPPDFTCFFHFVSCFILRRILERFWTLSGHHCYQKSEKQGFQCSMKRAYEKVSKKNAIWEPFKPRKLAPRAGGSTIL